MTDEQLLRYSRHLLLEGFNEQSQQQLLQAHVLVIGAGGLGCQAVLYLAAAGIGKLTIVDDDSVELSNLQRQIGHTSSDIGKSKVNSLVSSALAINPTIIVQALLMRVEQHNILPLVKNADVVVDCSDNFATRQLVNAACVASKKILVSGSAMDFSGQFSVYDLRSEDSACYACIFPKEHSPKAINCANMGVFAPIVGIVGSMQASETIKAIAQVGSVACGKLMLIDAKTMCFSEIYINKNPNCVVCGC